MLQLLRLRAATTEARAPRARAPRARAPHSNEKPMLTAARESPHTATKTQRSQ